MAQGDRCSNDDNQEDEVKKRVDAQQQETPDSDKASQCVEGKTKDQMLAPEFSPEYYDSTRSHLSSEFGHPEKASASKTEALDAQSIVGSQNREIHAEEGNLATHGEKTSLLREDSKILKSLTVRHNDNKPRLRKQLSFLVNWECFFNLFSVMSKSIALGHSKRSIMKDVAGLAVVCLISPSERSVLFWEVTEYFDANEGVGEKMAKAILSSVYYNSANAVPPAYRVCKLPAVCRTKLSSNIYMSGHTPSSFYFIMVVQARYAGFDVRKSAGEIELSKLHMEVKNAQSLFQVLGGCERISCAMEVVGDKHPPDDEELAGETWLQVIRKKVCGVMKKARKKPRKICKKLKKLKPKAVRFVKIAVRFVREFASKPTGPSQECFNPVWIEYNAHFPAEAQNNQPPPHALQDVSARLGTFSRFSSNLSSQTRSLARNGFFYNDDSSIQCHSCLQTNQISDVLQGVTNGHNPQCHYTKRLRQAIPDTPGRISDDVRDPPGQQSIYIPPGDVRTESYRLSTFENFPIPSSSSRRSLAKAGFFFTGFFDRVKCFACGRTVQQWQENDNPADQNWHKENCPFLRGEDCGNVPIGGHFNQFYGNLSTRSSPRNPGEEVIQQRDPVTGAIIRTVRYPADLPERIRQTGGTFEIGPNNQVTIRSGPGAAGMRTPGLQQAPARLPPSPFQQSQHQPMRRWRMANVISADHKRFLTNLYLNRELDRVASFARWPTGRPNVAPAALAKTGFFYLGDMDRTQCFSCGGVLRNWTADDDAVAEHHAHFPNCRFLLGTDTRNVPVPDLPVPPEERERDFPCRFPSNPHMRSEAARLETFDQRWPRERTAATPAEIAQAGFFYLGERDRVKCWYCNGGLQHWEYDDVPWIEHAKWFPNCQFLLSVKGQHFVYRHLAMSPQLPRPIIARQDGSPLEPGVEQSPSQPPEDIPPSAAGTRQPSPPPTIIDPQEEMRKKRQRIDDVMKKSDLVKNVLAMGFSDQIVRQLLVEKVDSGTEESAEDIYGSTVALLDDVMKREEELKQEEEQRSSVAAAAPSIPGSSTSYITSIPSVYSSMSSSFSSLGPAPGTGKYNVSYFGDEDEEGGPDMYGTEPMSVESSCNETPAKQVNKGEDNTSLQEALNKIEEERMCKVCFSNPADMVFVPCGHMCCCMECTHALRQCPVCRVKIEKAIKTYSS